MLDIIMTVLLVALSGIFSGLTLGLFSLDPDELLRKIEMGGHDGDLAQKIYPVRKNGNLLLCTLLLGNVAVNSTLSIFLGNVTSGVMGGLLATGLIVLFGEIVPQAAFSRYALAVGARTAWLVRIFMFVLWPACAPIAWVLDKALGAELPTIYSKKELALILEEHRKSSDSEIDSDDAQIAIGALTYSEKCVGDIMTPADKVVGLEDDTILTVEQLEAIKVGGSSRLPVWDDVKDNLVGVLSIKTLLGLRGDEGRKVSELALQQKHLEFTPDTRLDVALKTYLEVGHDFGVVLDAGGAFVGLVTMEDILEQIIQQEILDDDDYTS